MIDDQKVSHIRLSDAVNEKYVLVMSTANLLKHFKMR